MSIQSVLASIFQRLSIIATMSQSIWVRWWIHLLRRLRGLYITNRRWLLILTNLWSWGIPIDDLDRMLWLCWLNVALYACIFSDETLALVPLIIILECWLELWLLLLLLILLWYIQTLIMVELIITELAVIELQSFDISSLIFVAALIIDSSLVLYNCRGCLALL